MKADESRRCARCGHPLHLAAECPQCGAPAGALPHPAAGRAGSVGATGRRAPATTAVAIGLAALGAVAAAAWVARGRPAPAQAAPAGPVNAPPAEALHAEPAAASRPSAVEIARRATAASAVVSCDAGLGTAFFVAPDRAITNAHVLCGEGLLKVALADGRELLGKPIFSDDRIDVAVVDVVGASVVPLPVGDSTVLSPGDPISLVGSPSGLSFTVHEGRVSYVGRNVLGVGYLQVDANVNPGNSGGPLLDASGAVVGIVSMKVVGADGLGLALPIEYARPHAALPPPGAEAEARWRALASRIEEADRLEAERFSRRLAQPTILGVEIGWRGGVVLLVGRRFGGTPYDLPIDVEIRAGDRVVCEGSGRVEGWQSLERSLEDKLKRSSSAPQARWALRHGIARDVHVGAASIDLRGCKGADVPEKAAIAIRGGEQVDRPVAFPREAFSAAEERGRYQDRAEEDQRRQVRAQNEKGWRNAFQEAREEITRLEKRRRALTAHLEATPSDFRARDELAKAEAELPRARAYYDDLERKASLEAVPREWRQ